jgi:hypothetical protein
MPPDVRAAFLAASRVVRGTNVNEPLHVLIVVQVTSGKQIFPAARRKGGFVATPRRRSSFSAAASAASELLIGECWPPGFSHSSPKLRFFEMRI